MNNIITTALIAFVILTFLLLAFVIWKMSKKGIAPKEQAYIKKKWQEIMARAASDPRHSIMDADKLLDYTLGKSGFQGSLGEKLKKGKAFFGDLNGVWSAHKVRNRLAHELDFQISSREAERALGQFKRALRDLGLKL